VNKIILDWQRLLWEGDKVVEKKSGRDESVWIAIHEGMEAMLGISLYSYLYLKLAKPLSHYLLCFSPTKLENKRAEPWKWC
jgi:hypothetical protein